MAADYSAQIAALEAAIATGELEVRSDGDLLRYQTSADMLKALDHFRMLQNQANSTRPATTVAVFDPS